MTISRKDQAKCRTQRELIDLHQRNNPGANIMTSTAYANRILEARKNPKQPKWKQKVW